MPGAGSWLEGVMARNHAVIEAVMELQHGDSFLDSSKDPVRLHYLLRSDRWEVKVIHLIRDGRGVSNSYRKHEDADMTSAAWEWRRTHEKGARVPARLPRASTMVV